MALAILLSAGCAGTGERAEDAQSEAAVLAMDLERGAKLVRQPGASADDMPRRHGNVVHSFNLSVVSDTPGKVVERARAVIEEAGGRIEHASHDGTNGNLNAVVSVGALPEVRAKLSALGQRVVNENSDSRDQTHEINESRRRLDRIELARAEILDLLRRTNDPDAGEGLGMLLELTQQERRNLRAQLQSYHRQTEGVQLYMSVMSPEVAG